MSDEYGTEEGSDLPEAIAEPVEILDDDEGESQAYPLDTAYAAAGVDHITPELRQEVLGKLVQFEVALSGLATKQQNFVLAILQDPTNTREAGRKAGYNGTDAAISSHVSKLLVMPKIAHCISLGQQLREDRTMVSADRTLNELAIIAYSDISHYETVPGTTQITTRPGVPEHATRAVQSAEFTTTVVEGKGDSVTTTFKTKIKLWNKTDALRMLALYQKLFNNGEGMKIVDKSKHIHNTWQFGDRSITF